MTTLELNHLLIIFLLCFTARFQLDDGYPTLMFFEPGTNDSVVHRGPQDIHTLMAFVDEQMDRKQIEIKVSNLNRQLSVQTVLLPLYS